MLTDAQTLTLQDRADAYAQAFPQWPESHFWRAGRWLYAFWEIGNDYRNKTAYYGAYPARFLDRVMAMFPDVGSRVLHAFSGSLPPGPYDRCDMAQPAEFQCRVESLPARVGPVWPLVIADPPYSKADAAKYETPMINRRAVLAALAKVTQPDGHLVWLDTVWPMHSKRDWITVGWICLVRSTNHRAPWMAYGRCGYSNPPYGPFVQQLLAKAKRESANGFKSVLLLPMRVTQAFKAHVLHGARWLLFCDKRITFWENGVPRLNVRALENDGKLVGDPALFDSIIVVYDGVWDVPSIDTWKVPIHVTRADLERAQERRKLLVA